MQTILYEKSSGIELFISLITSESSPSWGHAGSQSHQDPCLPLKTFSPPLKLTDGRLLQTARTDHDTRGLTHVEPRCTGR